MITKQHSCKKVSKYQDRIYGKGARVVNGPVKNESDGQPQYRCTVCGEKTY